MTSKKVSKKDSGAKDDTANEISMAALTDLLEGHRTALSAEFKASITTLESKIDRIHTTIADHGERLVNLETFSNDASDRIAALETTCEKLMADNAKLRAKALDLESRSRRYNVRVIGLSEEVQPGPSPTTFFSTLLQKVLGDEILPTPPQLELAHRALTAKPNANERPRHVIIRLHSMQTKEKIVREARKRRADLQYEGRKISIYEDLPAEVMELRSEYRDVMAELYTLGCRPFFLYPSRLFVSDGDGNKRRLHSVDEAKKYVASKRK